MSPSCLFRKLILTLFTVEMSAWLHRVYPKVSLNELFCTSRNTPHFHLFKFDLSVSVVKVLKADSGEEKGCGLKRMSIRENEETELHKLNLLLWTQHNGSIPLFLPSSLSLSCNENSNADTFSSSCFCFNQHLTTIMPALRKERKSAVKSEVCTDLLAEMEYDKNHYIFITPEWDFYVYRVSRPL